LAPLKPQWQTISAAQKRKWLAMAKNFAALPTEEQNKLHARVQEWAQLSPQQRAQARLNFGESAQHSGDHKRAKWEAYQSLSAEEKSKLAATLPTPPVGAATAVKKVASHKLAASPAVKAPNLTGPKIDIDMLDPATLFADDAATQATVEECLRICAPVHIFSRYALEDVQLAEGVHIQKGQSIGLILAAANLDPLQFTEPLRFMPHRKQGANLSFGAGIHFCIGAPLARLELQVALPILFARLPGLRLAQRPVVKDVYHFHGLEAVNLEWG
jgi:hypothetical protein